MSAQTLDATIHEIRADLSLLPHLRKMHWDVPDSLNEFPAMVIYPGNGFWRLGTHAGDTNKPMRWAMHTIRIELHVARKDLARDSGKIMWFCDTLPDYLFAGFKRDTFSGTMVTMGDPRTANNATAPIRYQLLESGWGDTQTLIWRLEFDVSTELEINV